MASETQAVRSFQVMGTSDDVTECECCGRTNLKATVALQPLDLDGGPEGDVVYFGRTCAAHAMGRTVKYVVEQINEAEAAARAAVLAKREEEYAAYCAWLKETYGVSQPADLFSVGVVPFEALKRYRKDV